MATIVHPGCLNAGVQVRWESLLVHHQVQPVAASGEDVVLERGRPKVRVNYSAGLRQEKKKVSECTSVSCLRVGKEERRKNESGLEFVVRTQTV